MTEIRDRGYADPDVLVSTQWVAENLGRNDLRIVESNEDPLVYATGHVPGAVEIDWRRDLNDPIRRDYIDAEAFTALACRAGIDRETTVVFYGDAHNWWAAYVFWAFQLFGHTNARLMDGGREKWASEGRELTREQPEIAPTVYPRPERNDAPVRALRSDVLAHVESGRALVDVRSPEEYDGLRLHMPDYPNEGALRSGHIPGAKNVPWCLAVEEDGTFKTARKLRDVYMKGQRFRRDEELIAYCRIGERSSHTWFVLSKLLGFRNVRNYDGSWTEWGNLVGAPVSR